jgi:hypothetical protein
VDIRNCRRFDVMMVDSACHSQFPTSSDQCLTSGCVLLERCKGGHTSRRIKLATIYNKTSYTYMKKSKETSCNCSGELIPALTLVLFSWHQQVAYFPSLPFGKRRSLNTWSLRPFNWTLYCSMTLFHKVSKICLLKMKELERTGNF